MATKLLLQAPAWADKSCPPEQTTTYNQSYPCCPGERSRGRRRTKAGEEGEEEEENNLKPNTEAEFPKDLVNECRHIGN